MGREVFVIWKNKKVSYFENIDKRPKINKYNRDVALIVNAKRKSIQMYEELYNDDYYYHLYDWYSQMRYYNVGYVAIHYINKIDIIRYDDLQMDLIRYDDFQMDLIRYDDLQIDTIDKNKVVQVSYFTIGMSHLGTVKYIMSDDQFIELLLSKINSFQLNHAKMLKNDPNWYKSGLGYKAGR